ncbi:nuclear transport factor 2 family protein [Gemmatimonas sp.]|uniref:nuclear transport factor 2 family protein n=1 Tax=Gemmatimonas sp. TaxID=1962908 RepID=UPI00286A58CC|nr:nuclear transport factor 2 family protein [Gemmatimonas sp.]
MHQALVETLEASLRQAQLDGDVDSLERLIDEDLLFVGPDGALASKADDLALHRSGAVRFTSHEPTDLQWRLIAPDVLVVALQAHLEVLVHGQPVAGAYRYTRVWARREEQWRVVAGHVSAMPF